VVVSEPKTNSASMMAPPNGITPSGRHWRRYFYWNFLRNPLMNFRNYVIGVGDRNYKPGDRYLRSLFVAGALAVIRYAKLHGTNHRPWLTALLDRRPTKVAAIALANKLARMAWALMAWGERYNYPVALMP
jgi:hypothetical protein